MRSAFPGFPREAIQFFRGLARNNNRDWFLPRKTIFEDQVKQPMRELVAELNAALMGFAPEYVTDPDKAIYRIYRDTRFSQDKTPYKDHIAASFHRRGTVAHSDAGYYFAVSHKEVGIGGGVYMPAPETLLAIRHHIAARHQEFRRIVGARAVTAIVRRAAGGATFARAEGLLRAASRGRPAAIQAIRSVRRASAGSRHHARALRGNPEALSGHGAVSGISDRTAEGPAKRDRGAGSVSVNGTVTRSVTKLSHYRHKMGDDQSVPHMSAFLIVVLVGLVLLVAYHTGTYGRRGRRWGG